jgi:hypothetical protein
MFTADEIRNQATTRSELEKHHYEFEPGIEFNVAIHNTYIWLKNGELLCHVMAAVFVVDGFVTSDTAYAPFKLDWRVLVDKMYIKLRDTELKSGK